MSWCHSSTIRAAVRVRQPRCVIMTYVFFYRVHGIEIFLDIIVLYTSRYAVGLWIATNSLVLDWSRYHGTDRVCGHSFRQDKVLLMKIYPVPNHNYPLVSLTNLNCQCSPIKYTKLTGLWRLKWYFCPQILCNSTLTDEAGMVAKIISDITHYIDPTNSAFMGKTTFQQHWWTLYTNNNAWFVNKCVECSCSQITDQIILQAF